VGRVGTSTAYNNTEAGYCGRATPSKTLISLAKTHLNSATNPLQIVDDALSVVATLWWLASDRTAVIFGQLLGIGSRLHSFSVAACLSC
jgi:hypothetical protein